MNQNKSFLPGITLLIFYLISGCFICAQASVDHGKPLAPFRIAGNLYFVGDTYVASYLIATEKGNILINSDYPGDAPMIRNNIERLGFSYNDTKILLISHAHVDHAGGSARIKAETGAQYLVMAEDVPVVESGGKADFYFGNSTDPELFYPPAKADGILHDGDEVKLGNTVLVAHLTPGHTKGCITWTMTVKEEGKNYNVVIVGSPFINQGCKLVQNSAYPQISEDYRRTFQVLKSLPCDIFLGAHGVYFDLEKKYAAMDKSKISPFIDPLGYKKFVAMAEQDFAREFAGQMVKIQG